MNAAATRIDDRDGRGGKDPPRAPSVEGNEIETAFRRKLAQEQSGDQEAGQDVERVDADEPSDRTEKVRVEQHDEGNGDPAQSFEVGPDAR